MAAHRDHVTKGQKWPYYTFGKAVVCPMAPTAVICETQLCLNSCALGIETAWLF